MFMYELLEIECLVRPADGGEQRLDVGHGHAAAARLGASDHGQQSAIDNQFIL